MSEQIDLFFRVEAGTIERIPGPENALPLPDEDLEATGYKDIDAQTEEILAIEQELNQRSSPAELRKNPNPHKGHQAKCRTCKECYRWKGGPLVRSAYCPVCGTKLEATTYLNKWPWTEDVRPLTAVQAWAKFEKA